MRRELVAETLTVKFSTVLAHTETLSPLAFRFGGWHAFQARVIIAELPPATFSALSGNCSGSAAAESGDPFSSFFNIGGETPAEAPTDASSAAAPGASLEQLLSFASFFSAAPPAQATVEEGGEESAPTQSIPVMAEAGDAESAPVQEAEQDTVLLQALPVPAATPQQPVNTAALGWSLPPSDAPERIPSEVVPAQSQATEKTVVQGDRAMATEQPAELAFAARVKSAGSQAAESLVARPEIRHTEAPQADSGASSGSDSNSASENNFQPPKAAPSKEKPLRIEQAHGSISESTMATTVAPQPHSRSYASDTRTQELPSQPVEVPELHTEQATGQRDVSVRIAGEGDSSVDVRIMERGGELRVAVRSDHTPLRESLRTELPDLRMRMDQHGFRTETWHPTQVAAMGDSARAEQDSSGGPRQQHPAEEQQHQQRSRQQRPDWLEEIERQAAASA